MQQIQGPKKIQGSPPPLAEFGQFGNNVFIPQANPLTNCSITTGVDVQATVIHLTQIQALTSFAEHLAIGLAGTLNVLRTYNEPAIPYIMSILEPYIEPIPELDFHIPPKSSREVIIEVTREGRVPPKFYFDES